MCRMFWGGPGRVDRRRPETIYDWRRLLAPGRRDATRTLEVSRGDSGKEGTPYEEGEDTDGYSKFRRSI